MFTRKYRFLIPVGASTAFFIAIFTIKYAYTSSAQAKEIAGAIDGTKTFADNMYGSFGDVVPEYLHHPASYCKATDGSIFPKLWRKVQQRPLRIFVMARPNAFELRDVIRLTWASVRINYTKIVFCLGVPEQSSEQAWIDKEAVKYGDILQYRLTDNYRNLAYKTFFAINWAAKYCGKDSLVMKTDSDAILLLRHLDSFRNGIDGEKRKMMWGDCGNESLSATGGGSPARTGKWGVTKEEYSSNWYPSFCRGLGYIMTGDVPPLLIETAKVQKPYFHLEDVMFTGIAPQRANVPRYHIPGIYPISSPDRHCSKDVIVYHLWDDDHVKLEEEWQSYLAECSVTKPTRRKNSEITQEETRRLLSGAILRRERHNNNIQRHLSSTSTSRKHIAWP